MNNSKFDTKLEVEGGVFVGAAERLWEKLEFWTNDISLELYDPEKDVFNGTWFVVAAGNDLMDFLVDEVEEQYNTELNDLQKDWAIYMFLHHSMPAYNEEFGRKLEPKE